ncbi:uncharacterized protein LOC106641644 [Copidosoma floridanum]|uniref:uncharacterized protein LOC106641644 n=1 Tax=Copidosoma floridanum TaxID=29053 RepID=UPI0006C95401|nr:uncharacterized protein LOC106641644 [Copidosoma floridanum]
MGAEYAQFMAEYIALGHMRPLTYDLRTASSRPVHYVQHHGIWQSSDKGRRLRVVFNASKPTLSSYSLNDVLFAGPRLQTTLPSVLLRWRRHRIAFCSDVRMMFRQIRIDKRELDLQRILWGPDPNQLPTDYQLLTVTYGASYSPYLTLRTVHQLCKDEGHRWPKAVTVVIYDRYVDDILSGADDIATARHIRDQLIELLQAGGCPLRKWVANVPELLDDLPDDVSLRPTWCQLGAEGLVSELSVSWNPPSDCFLLTPPLIQHRTTKRTMLAALAGVFDPCGWLALIVLNAKLLLQDLWWTAFATKLQAISGQSLLRWIGTVASVDIHLHVFSDASRHAMAAVLYSRLEAADGSVRCHILLARTKLAPIRTLKPMAEPVARMTIPRLELCAALLAAKLLRSTAEELAVLIERCHAWCDSQIVLHWVRSDQPTNNALVDNYVAQIQDTLPPSAWRYVPSQSNPADVATRSVDMSGLRQHLLWWDGPPWLADNDRAWPQEALQEVTHLPLAATPPIWLSRAYLNDIPSFTLYSSFSCALNGKRLPKGNPLNSLAAFLDTNGVLRVGRRLGFSSLPYEERHPPILRGASSLASLVFSWAHSRALYGEYRVTSAYAAKRAWILGGPRRIKAQLQRCVVCSRLQGRSTTQMMAPVSASRVTPSCAFGRTGVDYAGPFSVLASKGRDIRTMKGYIAVFMCMTTKALHLELVSDLSTATFLGALAQFTGRRGRPSEVWSDNATCFRRADLELREALQIAEINWDLVAGSLASQGIAWDFIPPGAPHFVGLWEAAVKSVKGHLRRVMGSRHLTYEEFSTVLVGIEMVLNGRPLTPLSGDPSDLEVLTPGHFLVGAPLDSIIQPGPPTENLDAL